jgi:hypothetical protein
MAALIAEIKWTEAMVVMVGTFAVALLIPLSAIIGAYWYKLHKVRSDNELKQSMIERGLSVDEIERVIAAGNQDFKKACLNRGMSAEEIDRVMAAGKGQWSCGKQA